MHDRCLVSIEVLRNLVSRYRLVLGLVDSLFYKRGHQDVLRNIVFRLVRILLLDLKLECKWLNRRWLIIIFLSKALNQNIQCVAIVIQAFSQVLVLRQDIV